MINTILIDDEAHCLDSLSILLNKLCPDVQVLQRCSSAKQGLEAIMKYKTDLVFLDVEMPSMNGFEFLQQFKEIPFSVIFTTAYDKYAIKAIRFSALDYLLKPIDIFDLENALNRHIVKKQFPSRQQELVGNLISNLQQKDPTDFKLALSTMEGVFFFEPSQIMR